MFDHTRDDVDREVEHFVRQNNVSQPVLHVFIQLLDRFLLLFPPPRQQRPSEMETETETATPTPSPTPPPTPTPSPPRRDDSAATDLLVSSTREELRLLSTACMMIARKYEDVNVLPAVAFTSRCISIGDLLSTERRILKWLRYEISPPIICRVVSDESAVLRGRIHAGAAAGAIGGDCDTHGARLIEFRQLLLVFFGHVMLDFSIRRRHADAVLVEAAASLARSCMMRTPMDTLGGDESVVVGADATLPAIVTEQEDVDLAAAANEILELVRRDLFARVVDVFCIPRCFLDKLCKYVWASKCGVVHNSKLHFERARTVWADQSMRSN